MTKKFETIECPKCHHNFPNPILEQSLEEVDNLREEVASLKQAKQTVEQDHTIALKNAEIAAEKVGFNKAKKLLNKKTETNNELQTENLELKTKMQELEGDVENAVHTATLNVQAKFDKKLRKQRKQDEQKFDQRVIDKANEKNASINLELAQKREENKNLRSKIDELNRGSKNVSQEEKGEAGENYAQDLVKKLFPMDQVSEVKKGQRGADIIHTLMNSFGPIGKILIESKNTQSFQKSWIEKLESDLHEHNISVGLLVSYTQPEDPFAYVSRGIFIASFTNFETVLQMLRASLVKQFRSQKLEENKNEKAVRVYDFFKSDIFANQMRKLVDFHKLRVEQLDNEERYLTVQIKKRRHHLAYEVNFVMGFLGVLEAEGGTDDFKLLNEQLGLIIPDFDDTLAKELQ